MKILITGTYSSGKTTLCQKILGACLSNGWQATAPIEIARTIKIPLNTQQNNEISSFLIGAQLSAEKLFENTNDIFICDRGIPDIWSHNLALKQVGFDIKCSALEALARTWSQSYDFVIQSTCDHSIAIPEDGIRNTSTSYREMLELCHRESMSFLGIRPDLSFSSDTASIEATLNAAINYISQRMAPRASSTIS